MKVITKFLAAGVVVSMATSAFAADHRDGPATLLDAAADINDLYAFPNGNNLVLAMTVMPFADKSSAQFSDAVRYVFHTESQPAFGATTTGSEDIICTFAVDQKVSCWAGTADYVTGDASAETGLVSASGKMKVFTGVRSDAFYFYLTGFKNARTAVLNAIPGLLTGGMVYASGCPKLDAATVTSLHTALTAPDQQANDFRTANTLAIVVELDKSLVTKNADEVVSVWASTNN